MKKLTIHCGYILFCCLMAACSGSAQKGSVELKGEIKGAGNDTLYLYGNDQFYNHTDTIPLKGGRFKVYLQADTLSDTRLCFANGEEFPLFFRPGDRLVLKGDTLHVDALQVSGNEESRLLTSFFQETASMSSQEEIAQKAEEYIRSHPDNLAILYLLDRYIVQSQTPDFKQIEELIAQMNNTLRDRPYIDRLSNLLEEKKKAEVGRVAPYFTLNGWKGKRINRSDYKERFLLLLFWASWDEHSRSANKQWRELYNNEKKNTSLALVGISLDSDRQQWLDAIEHDSLTWDQGIEQDGWNSKSAELYGIDALPANILIDPKGKIVGRNVTVQAVSDSIKNKK